MAQYASGYTTSHANYRYGDHYDYQQSQPMPVDAPRSYDTAYDSGYTQPPMPIYHSPPPDDAGIDPAHIREVHQFVSDARSAWEESSSYIKDGQQFGGRDSYAPDSGVGYHPREHTSPYRDSMDDTSMTHIKIVDSFSTETSDDFYPRENFDHHYETVGFSDYRGVPPTRANRIMRGQPLVRNRPSHRGGPPPRGIHRYVASQQVRSDYDGTDGYQRGGMMNRGASRSRGRGANFNVSGAERRRGLNRGGQSRGRLSRGRQSRGGVTRGGQSRGGQSKGGDNHVHNNIGGGNVRRGRYQAGNRGRGQSSRRGSEDQGRGQSRGAGSTRGRGWIPESMTPDVTPIGEANEVTGRGGQNNGIRRGQDNNRGQHGGARGRGQKSNATRGGAKMVKPFKMPQPDASGYISYKNSLQEYAQKNHRPIPNYTCQKADVGYTASVMVDNMMFSSLQSQIERKEAEQSAAFEALKAFGYIDYNETFSPKFSGKGKKRSMDEDNEGTPATKMMKQETPENTVVAAVQSFKSKLNEAIMKWKLDLPTYNTVRTAGGFLSTLVFNGQVYEGVQVYGTKKLAEQHVAEIVYNQVDLKAEANAREGRISAARQDASLNAGDTNVPAVPTTAPAAGISESPNPVAPKSKPLKNIVQEYCQQNGLKLPVYNTVKDSGMFIATVNVNGVDYVGTPHIMKKTAENNSAKKVCESLGLK